MQARHSQSAAGEPIAIYSLRELSELRSLVVGKRREPAEGSQRLHMRSATPSQRQRIEVSTLNGYCPVWKEELDFQEQPRPVAAHSVARAYPCWFPDTHAPGDQQWL